MKPIEAKEALIKTIDEICSAATERGLNVNVNCYFSDRELEPIAESEVERAAILSASVSIGEGSSDISLLLECAIAIDEGEVLNDEIIREAVKLRSAVSELCEKLDSGFSVKDAISSMDEGEQTPDEPVAHDNRAYYIGGAVVVAVILLLILLL